jgi:hypothetical protein
MAVTRIGRKSAAGIVKAVEPSELHNTWPLWEQPRQFELGRILNCVITDLVDPPQVGILGLHHAGCWECNLKDDSLTWSGGVYDIFGLPRGAPISRDEAVARYCEHSRAVMERLRTYAIKHKRGFTIDAEIHAAVGANRWMRLIAAPVCDGARVIALHGLKMAT